METFQGKYIQLNVVPNSDKTDQQIVSEPLVHEIALGHITANSPENWFDSTTKCQAYSSVCTRGFYHFSRQEHAQQASTSHVTTYQYLNSSIMPNQECLEPHITSTSSQIPVHASNSTAASPLQSKDNAQNNVVTQHYTSADIEPITTE